MARRETAFVRIAIRPRHPVDNPLERVYNAAQTGAASGAIEVRSTAPGRFSNPGKALLK